MNTHPTEQLPPTVENYGRGVNLARELNVQGISYTYQPVEETQSPTYESVFTLHHEAQPTTAGEPVVRLYRGVDLVDASVLHQVPYALRIGNPDTETDTAKAVAAVEAFVQQPSMANLLDYSELIKVDADQAAQDIIDSRIDNIEQGILRGRLLIDVLKEEHIKSFVGRGTIDLSPFIATTTDPKNAQAFGRGVVLVLDVPRSLLAGEGENNEVLLAGPLPAECITAVAVKRSEYCHYGIESIFGLLPPTVENMVPGDEPLAEIKEIQLDDEARLDEDFEIVVSRRLARLAQTTPSELLADTELPTGDDRYWRTLELLYDKYLDKLPDYANTPYDDCWKDPQYVFDKGSEPSTRKPGIFERAKVTEMMLAELKHHYAQLVKTEARRAARRAARFGSLAIDGSETVSQ